MDPDENLQETRRIIKAIEAIDDPHSALRDLLVEELIEHVAALDEWLSSGGFFPKQWIPNKYGRAVR